MGRKPAPQPLALSDSSASLARGNPPMPVTSSQGVSPADSKSPKSPRSSPFHSRFSPLKKQQLAQQKEQREQRLQQSQQQSQPQPQQLQASQLQQQQPQGPTQQGQQPQQAAVQHQTSGQSQKKLQPRDEPSNQHQAGSEVADETIAHPPTSPSAVEQPGAPSSNKAPQPLSTPNQATAPSQSQVSNESKKSTKNGFFHFNKASKSSNQYQPQVHQYNHGHHQNNQNYTESRSQMMSRGGDGTNRSKYGVDPSQSDHSLQKPIPTDPSRSDLSVSSAGENDNASPQTNRKGKPKPFGLLSRSKSIREGDNASPISSPKDIPLPPQPTGHEPELYLNSMPLKTAPVNPDRSFRDMMSSAVRNRSEDRAPIRDVSATREGHRERESRTQPSSLRENGGSSFLSGLRSSSTRAADMFSKGFFGKSSRSGSTTEREPVIDDEHYQLKVINLPLIEQTRLTRISKRLEDSRDKTEFWMPAFPWRAIDYLNYKGCEVEGLYRVPGSGPQIKKWQRKFDEQYDVNLFEADDLYDINIIGSMLKAWLRELPDELFPKAAQERVARECAGAEKVPDLLIEELSNLSPFNYYLLFAITCHLSLLLAHSDKNKMDFRNLCICFQPCMKIDAFCFRFLVCDWRDCWKGCKNESKYIEEEYSLFDQPPPRGLAEPQKPSRQESDGERQQLSSSDSSKPSGTPPMDQKARPKRKPLQLSESNGSVGSNNSSISTTLTINSDRDRDREINRTTGDLRPLSPIKPLSPLGF